MKLSYNGTYTRWNHWAFGIFMYRVFGATYVLLVGTSDWTVSLSRKSADSNAWALKLGPVSFAGAR